VSLTTSARFLSPPASLGTVGAFRRLAATGRPEQSERMIRERSLSASTSSARGAPLPSLALASTLKRSESFRIALAKRGAASVITLASNGPRPVRRVRQAAGRWPTHAVGRSSDASLANEAVS
jgi:hypothetical protein